MSLILISVSINQRFITSESYSIWFDIAANVQSTLKKKIKKTLTTTTSLHSPTILLHQQRLIKSPAEQNLMREACRIGSEALNETMKESKPGKTELIGLSIKIIN